MPNQFLSDEFGDIEDYFVTDYRLIDNFVGDSLWIWGTNNDGQLGNFTNTPRNTPVTTFAGGNNWKQVSAGRTHTAAIKTDGSLWVWGEGTGGRLGVNDTTDRNTPVTTFAGGNDWKQVSCGYNHTAAIKTDGSLWTWGRNGNGQLGNNALTTRTTPVTTFAGGNDWKQVSPGQTTMAIKTDGTLWDTRNNEFTFAQRFSGDNNWKSVSSGGANQFLIGAIKYVPDP